MKNFPRWAKWLSRIILAPLGFVLGYYVGDLIAENVPAVASEKLYVFLAVYGSSTLMLLIMFLIAPTVCYYAFLGAQKLSSTLKHYSPQEVIAGVLGLLLGLAISYFVTRIFNYIPNMPVSLAVVCNVIIYLGISMFSMVVGVNNFKGILPARVYKQSSANKILDSSILIDGRIVELVKLGFLEATLVIPGFVLKELRRLADSGDSYKRAKGKLGLDNVKKLQEIKRIEVSVDETVLSGDNDSKLIELAKMTESTILTMDNNLKKVAEVSNVKALNLNELSNSMKLSVVTGDRLEVDIVKQGKDTCQGVAYLDDGTMIVVENGGEYVGQRKLVIVGSSLQTNSGKIIFARVEEEK